MRILVGGASGFIGKPLVSFLRKRGDEVVRLVRTSTQDKDAIVWDPESEVLRKEQFVGFDAVIYLAGETLAGFWTQEKRKRILLSRTVGTRLLSKILSQSDRLPKVFISPSAIGYYGDRKEERLTEQSSNGSTFLARVCREWEAAASALEAKGCRTVHPRFGIVLGKGGGILDTLLTQYRLGLGGTLGSGRQWLSFVALDDVIRVFTFILDHQELTGPCNVVSEYPVRQEDFSRTLATLLNRPRLLPQPAWVLRLLFGQMADELLLASAKAYPEKLLRAGFSFNYPTLDSALRIALN